MKGFWGAAAAARVSYAQYHLPRSARTGLRTGSSSAHCDWMAHGLCRGAALAPLDACNQRARVRQNGCGNGSLIMG